MDIEFNIVIPAKNEAVPLGQLLRKLKSLYPQAGIIVVNDGSTDTTADICIENGVTLINHPYSMGNGAAIKSGARAAQAATIVFMDADGQHRPEDIQRLLHKMDEGYDMVVGARGNDTQASIFRSLANRTYNRLASVMTGYRIEDLTSGFRAVRTRHFRKFLYLLPNGFSYPTTSTMAFFRSGLPVAYVPIQADQREGKSNIRLFRDGTRFFVIIVKVGALFSPMRLFLPISGLLFSLGWGYYAYTLLTQHRFTNMSALLFTTSVIVFLIGVLSEQVSALHYKGTDSDMRRTDRGNNHHKRNE